MTLAELGASLHDCQRCKLSKLGRTQVVFGTGNPHATIMFVGEGPGYYEDQQGEPFVGAAGKLLNELLQSAGSPARRSISPTSSNAGRPTIETRSRMK